MGVEIIFATDGSLLEMNCDELILFIKRKIYCLCFVKASLFILTFVLIYWVANGYSIGCIIPASKEVVGISVCTWIGRMKKVQLLCRNAAVLLVGMVWIAQFYLKLFNISNPIVMTVLTGYCFSLLLLRARREEGNEVMRYELSFMQELSRWIILRIVHVVLNGNLSLLVKATFAIVLFTFQTSPNPFYISLPNLWKQFRLQTILKACLLNNGLLAQLFSLHCLDLLTRKQNAKL